MSNNNAPTTKPQITLFCERSGIKLGDFQPADYSSLGASPFVYAWKKTTFLHPVFGLQFGDVVRKATACIMLENAGDKRYGMQYKQLLMLALLHASNAIKQDIPCLPTPKSVELYFSKIVEILSWKLEVNTDRLQLPRFHVWKGAALESASDPFATLGNWIIACESVREEYESVTRTRKASAKEKARELAMKSIKRNLYQDVSLRRLWNWLETQVDSMEMSNNAELEQLFFVEESKVQHWDLQDIQALEDLFVANCELGNSISHEIQKRITQIRSWRTNYSDAFEIVLDNEFPESKGIPEPKQEDFPSRAAFSIASAKWKLANKPVVSTTSKSIEEEL